MQDTVDQAHGAVLRTLADIIEDAPVHRAAASSSRSQVAESVGSAYAFLTCNASSVSVPWCPSLATVVVTHFDTQLVGPHSSCPLRRWLAARTLPRMGQLVEAAWITVSGTAIVGLAGFGAAIYTAHRSLANTREQKVWDERARTYIDAIEAVHYRQNKRDYEMRAATLDEKTRQHAEAYLATYTEPDAFELEARLIAFASPEVVTAMQKSSTAHRDAVEAFAADRAALRAQEANGDPVPDDQVSQLLQWTMSTGARQEANKADDAVIELIRTDLHGRGHPLPGWEQLP